MVLLSDLDSSSAFIACCSDSWGLYLVMICQNSTVEFKVKLSSCDFKQESRIHVELERVAGSIARLNSEWKAKFSQE